MDDFRRGYFRTAFIIRSIILLITRPRTPDIYEVTLRRAALSPMPPEITRMLARDQRCLSLHAGHRHRLIFEALLVIYFRHFGH